ncbi:pentapeptide repeat-containing protein [Streptomyces niveus]|uniref:pentapeptide repeat-containing protein n=1 Tax=Streptomyces niveus TaxID=193462 RepID=UPI0036E013E2
MSVLVASLVAVVGLWYSNVQIGQANDQARQERGQVREELALAKESQITDRYTAAVGLLADDAVGVRLGGIYALRRIMQDSPRDHPTIANVLVTYIRGHAGKPSPKGGDLRADVNAAFSALAGRDPKGDGTFALDLSRAQLSGARLASEPVVGSVGSFESASTPVRLANADLSYINLNDADMYRADLRSTDLFEADLSNAELSKANLRKADLASANLAGTWLSGANLSQARLSAVNADGAVLSGADLSGANLRGAVMTAELDGADLSGATLAGADLRGANLSGADLRSADLNLSDLRDADLSRADLRGADLSEADVSNLDQVLAAEIDRETKLPSGIAKDQLDRDRIDYARS